MDESLRAQIDSNLSHIDSLIRRGRRVREALASDPADKASLVANRAWQMDVGAAISQLSGGSKAHWLARAFSQAFLLRADSGAVVESADPGEIVGRLIAVLEQAAISLSQMGTQSVTPASAGTQPPPRRFEFVQNAGLRPVLEQAYAESRDALDRGEYGPAMITSAGILEAIITDALETKGLDALVPAVEVPAGKIADWPFSERIAVAEKAGLIRGGCARLPDNARNYRQIADAEGNPKVAITEKDARRTLQVLHVVMRDFDPGR